MNETIYLKKLEQREIKPTAIRLLILKTMMQHKEAFSLLDLENELDTVDKSTIYRTITLFLAHHLIHGIDAVSYTHLTLPTMMATCRSRWSPYH